MIDPLGARLEAWMQDVGRFDAADADDLVRGLSIPRRRGHSMLGGPRLARVGAVAGLVIAIGVGVGLLSGIGGPGGRPAPPDPRAFAGDDRLARCSGIDPAPARYAFELAHAADFQTALPGALRTPELERPDPAFVVVFASDGDASPAGGGAHVPGSPSPTEDGRGSSVCVIVGSGPDAEINLYTDVDLTGFNADAVRQLGPTSAEPAPSATPAPTLTANASTTPMPADPGTDWGPLAVVPPSDGADTALIEGTVRISAGCVVLDAPGAQVLLVWPADRTSWDAASSTISFENFDGATVTVVNGETVALGGSGEAFEESGTSLEAWLDATDWVARPPGPCEADEYWYVGEVFTFSFDVENRSSIGVIVSVTSDTAATMPGFAPGQGGTISIKLLDPTNGIVVEVQGAECQLLASAMYPTPESFTLVVEDGDDAGAVKLRTRPDFAAPPIPLPSNSLVGCGG